MKSSLHCFGVGVVLLSLAPSTLSFSRGANYASCQEMTPGHIRAQPQDPQRSHVTLRTSASSYLPGQLVTVTVRSSRDFMGFLLQARSMEGTKEAGAGAGVKARARAGVGAGVKSMRVGPVLVGGSWTLTPPGTHSLRCLSEGDTLTHSDKQPKRNLSFVWRAPDTPMGDIRFYITVVQSYFVYWAGIESAVVRDGSRSPWSESNITGVDEGSSIFALQEDKVTAPPALRTHRVSFKQTGNEIANPPTTLQPPTTTSSGTQSYKSPETPTEVTRSILEMNSSATLASLAVNHLTNQAINKRNISVTLGSLQNSTESSETDIYVTSGYLSGMTEEAGTNTGNLVTHTKDPKSSFFSSTHLPFTASFSSDEAKESTSPHPGPSPAPRRSLYNPFTSSSLPFPSQKLTLGQRLLIQNPIASSDPEPNLNPPTPSSVVHPNPVPHPNLVLNAGHELKPNPPESDTKPKRPSNPSRTPDKDGKYPDIIPRHSTWEVGMLLGCSAGLGMVLVVGIRYVYRQTCGKRTEVTLNDREREYGTGERGLIHVQECGDLVRVRRIRENSFVLLAEYDILAAPGD
ncbi:reelin domain-containing protein 1-like [Thunnus thynnus]|uniref:reelin domain-containing protein 1-like n=1 Tax=Thunnus thynnus TaxID=8237 RepID=UPI003529BBE4